MSDFKRELRYFIFKTKHLTQEQHEQLLGIADSINHPPLECVVVESDWPNYEDTWKAVEQVANGEYQSPYDLIEQQRRRIAELEATVERLREQLSAMAAQHQCGCGHPACNRCRDDADNREVLRATPQQNLNAIKREVAKNAFIAALHTDMQVGEEQQKAEEYANTNYPSGKDGE